MKVCEKDWFGADAPYKPQMSLTVGEEFLDFRFQVNKTPHFNSERKFGDFVPRLSDWDVAEFFLAGTGQDYQEVNVSPTGAWWSAYFEGYRVEPRELRYPSEIVVEKDDSSWSMSFRTELKHFIPWMNSPREDWRISVTSILYDPEPTFYCWNHFTGGEPDYHRVDIMRPVF